MAHGQVSSCLSWRSLDFLCILLHCADSQAQHLALLNGKAKHVHPDAQTSHESNSPQVCAVCLCLSLPDPQLSHLKNMALPIKVIH